jgi:hypothetical protein
MEIIQINHDKKVFGFQVKTFPNKIGEAFDALMQQIPEGDKRSYYGISWIEHTTIIYYAAAEQKSDDEAQKFNAREFTIGKGNYLREVLTDWMPKVGQIKEIFDEMLKDPRVDLTKPAIEWYKSDSEMWCMMKIRD